MANNLNNITNLLGVKTAVKTWNKKIIKVLLWGYWKGNHKRDGKFYLVTRTETSYIPDLSVNIFSMTHALTKGFNMTSEKESLILKKNATILKFEDHLYHGNEDISLLDTRVYASPKHFGKMLLEGNNLEGKTTTNL